MVFLFSSNLIILLKFSYGDQSSSAVTHLIQLISSLTRPPEGKVCPTTLCVCVCVLGFCVRVEKMLRDFWVKKQACGAVVHVQHMDVPPPPCYPHPPPRRPPGPFPFDGGLSTGGKCQRVSLWLPEQMAIRTGGRAVTQINTCHIFHCSQSHQPFTPFPL